MTNSLTNLTYNEAWSIMYAALCEIKNQPTRETKDAQWAIVDRATKVMLTAEKLEEKNYDWEKLYEHLKDGHIDNNYYDFYEEWYEVA